MWTSDQQVIQYMVVTCHFVDSTLSLQKCILNFLDVPTPHTGLVISNVLHKCLVEWGIEKNTWTCTFDNATNNDAAIKYLKDTLKYVVALPLDGKFFHIKCCVHILNILVQYGMTEIESAVHNVRASVKYITNSVSLLQVFGDIVSQLRLPDIKLILDCGTRWNATYAMVVVAIGYKDVFSRYADKDLSYSFLPSDEDREKAKLVCNFLEEFDMITNLISGTDYPTSNLLLPELWHIKKILDEACSSEDSCLMKMATKMKKKFDKYWGDCNLLISLAAILDPRNKIKFIEFAFTEIY